MKYERHTKLAPKNQNWCAYILKDQESMNNLTDNTPSKDWEDTGNYDCEVSISIDTLGKFEDVMTKYKIPTVEELDNIIGKALGWK